MESKEHIFLFLPFLAIVILALLNFLSENFSERQIIKKPLIFLSSSVVVLGLLMLALGYLVSTGARLALEL
jgi:asparagine N-glycosylation enzyme membrane subunit Stt3